MRQSQLTFDPYESKIAGMIVRIKTEMSLAVEGSGQSREQVLDRMNEIFRASGVRLSGGNTKSLGLASFEKMLNANDREHNPSLIQISVFCQATGSIAPIEVLLDIHGLGIMTERDLSERDYGRACLALELAQKTKHQMRAIAYETHQ